jgi:hypothetical protein
MKTTSVLFSASIIVCLIMACSIPLGGGGKSTVIRLDNIEISCSVPKKEYIVSDQLMKDDVASMTFECPALKTSNGYTVVPLFSMYIEKDRFSDEKAKAALDPVVYNNRSRAVYEAKTIAILNGPERLFGGAFTETVQQRKYGGIANSIYQATTTRGKYGIRVVYQVPSDVYDQGFHKVQSVIKTFRIAAPQ